MALTGDRECVFEVAPALLKSKSRIEVYFFPCFVAHLVEALIQRGMVHARIPSLPLHPEDRTTRRPTGEQIFPAFGMVNVT